jgi:lipoyl(octanoyl) transferase
MTLENKMQQTVWRLIRTAPAEGAWNMALDEAILESAGQKKVLPTLRLYAWEPPCLSLGFAQPTSDVDLPALEIRGWQLVRRPTGGRAILHADELTYSVTAPLDEPRVAGGILESYRRLAQGLLYALELLGLPARADKEYAVPEDTQAGGPVCFEVPSNYEITVAGKKLVGSAQARRKDGVLQHGSLPLYGDLTRITQALVYPDQIARGIAARRLLEHAANTELLGYNLSWESAAAAFQAAFQETLGLELSEEPLTPAELQRAEQLVNEKYAHRSWTFRF